MSAVTGFRVPPTSRQALARLTQTVRVAAGVERGAFPIVPFIEHTIPIVVPGFDLQVVPCDEMKAEHAIFYPRACRMIVREDVYERACNGRGRDRMTLAHELGHLVLHRNVPLARTAGSHPHEAFRDSEWQATAFGALLLMPTKELVECATASEAAARFGVSFAAANYEMRMAQKRKSLS